MFIDGKTCCDWVNPKNQLYIHYHNEEWGVPVHEDRTHFEFIILEGVQAGLSWEVVLNKRENYRSLLHNFTPERVAKFTDKELEELIKNPGIIRNRLKVYSLRNNARAFLQIQKDHGSFDDFIWQFVNHNPIQNNWNRIEDVPAKTAISDEISKTLKKYGFSFVGSTIMYAYLQACGLVNDHVTTCFRYKQLNQNSS